MAESEFILLRRFSGNGDTEAFTQIVKQHAPLVYGVCLRILGNKDNAADAVQETFLQLVRDAAEITDSLPNWLHRVAKNRSIELIRHDSSIKQREKLYAADSEKRNIQKETVTWRKISCCIDEELDKLDNLTREVIILHFLEGQ
ncbi:MAG: sigma-70 family RNA polymerase sigma factor, partial [Sedimentisphaerales bacterium]|nr:sigma-70 family RNA polymerase sigma factor [Sedimentisphaerales bacterium]